MPPRQPRTRDRRDHPDPPAQQHDTPGTGATATHTPAGPAGRRADLAVLAGEAVLLAVAAVVGALLTQRGVRLWVEAPPLYARWMPHLGPGTVPALAVAAVVVGFGPGWARRARWPVLLVTGYLTALAWTLSLAFVDGWSRGLATRLTPQAEYLNDVPKVTSIPATLSGFTDHIIDFQPGSWATHVAGHPPGALLFFVLLDRIGLAGGGPAAVACVLAGASVAVSVPAALRGLGAEPAARTVLPFVVLFPGAVWLGASADALFTAVVAGGLALLAATRPLWAVLGGVLLGCGLYLSYGLVLAGALALTVLGLRARARWAALAGATVGVGAVVVGFTAAGFWWLDGYQLVVRRYYQGWAADRPYGYWVWANLAALVLCAGPAAGPALRRALASAGAAVRRAARRPARWLSPLAAAEPRLATVDRRAAAIVWLPLAAGLAIVAADLSGLSKAEVERIWLPYALWLLPATALVPAGHRAGRAARPGHRWLDRRVLLALQAVTALAVNHLLLTYW